MTTDSKATPEAIISQINELVKKGDYFQIAEFLNTYKAGNGKLLKSELKKLKKYWLEYTQLSPVTYGYRANKDQENTLAMLALGILAPSEINGGWRCIRWLFWDRFFFKDDKHLALLHQFTKKNIQTVINQIYGDDDRSSGIDYKSLRQLEALGLIDYEPTIFVRSFGDIDREYYVIKNNHMISLYFDKIFFDDITIEREMPAMFYNETNMENWQYYDKKKPFYLMSEYLISQNKLDKAWVLQKCLEIQSSLWRDGLKKFYRELFIYLSPTADDVFDLQEIFITLLMNENKTVVNFALKQLKECHGYQEFNTQAFIDAWQFILSSGDNKTAIKSIISMAQTLLKNDKKKLYTANILSALTAVFMLDDLAIQERTAKLFIKYIDNKDKFGDVIEMLNLYQGSLLSDSKAMLKELLTLDNDLGSEIMTDAVQSYHHVPQDIDYFNPNRQVLLYDEFNELLFAISGLQADGDDDVLRYEIILNSLLAFKQTGQMSDDRKQQLKELLKVCRESYFGGFKDIFNYNLYNIMVDYENCNLYNQIESSDYKVYETWEALIKSFENLWCDDECSLSFLSLPTHYPAFIFPEILLKRMLDYQKQNKLFSMVDLSIALARTPKKEIQNIVPLIEQLNSPQIKEVLYCHFGITPTPDTVPPQTWQHLLDENKKSWIGNALGNLLNKKEQIECSQISPKTWKTWRALWRIAVVTNRSTLTTEPNDDKKALFERVINDTVEIDYYQEKPLTPNGYAMRLKIPLFDKACAVNDLYNRQCYRFDPKDIYWHRSVYDTWFLGSDTLLMIKRLSGVNHRYDDKNFADALFSLLDSGNIRLFTAYLQTIKDDAYLLNEYSIMCLVYLCFHAKKEIRLSVLDALLEMTADARIDDKLFVKYGVLMIQSNYVPFSRFYEVLYNLSQYQGIYGAFVLVVSQQLLKQLTFDKPPTGFKKLLELYYVLLSAYQTMPDKETLLNLNKLSEKSATLASMVKKLHKLNS